MKTRLPVLEDLRIASPCNADWDEMAGDGRVRFCGKCEKNVYNLSQMTRVEAEGLVREREGRLCVRFYQRQDGTVLTTDCPVAVRRERLRQRVWASLSGLAASAMLLLGSWCGRARADLTLSDGKKPPSHVRLGLEKMGKMGEPAPSPNPQWQGQAVMRPPVPPQPPLPLMGKPKPPPRKLNQGGPMAIQRFMGDIDIDK